MLFKIFKLGQSFKVVWYKTNARKHDFSIGSPEELSNEEKLECNLRRAKSRIRELALCNEWEYFVTLTLDKRKIDRYDLDGYIKKLGQWVRDYWRKYGVRPKYLIIPEQHRNGAWHIHGLMNGLAPESLVINRHGYFDLPFYRERFGFISLGLVKDHVRVSSYITKYVTKAINATDIKLRKHSFYSSNGLKGQELVHEDYTGDIPANVWSNDYVGIQFFDTQDDLTNFILAMQRKDEAYELV